MTDTVTGEPLLVKRSGTVSYLMLPYSQVAKLRPLLDSEGIRYEVSEDVVSSNGKPGYGWIKFGRKGDPERIQTLLNQCE